MDYTKNIILLIGVEMNYEKIVDLIIAYEKYILLLNEELSLVASAYGWKPSRYELGKKSREEIERIKN